MGDSSFLVIVETRRGEDVVVDGDEDGDEDEDEDEHEDEDENEGVYLLR